MSIIAELPGGVEAEFPDGTHPDDIHTAVKSYWSKQMASISAAPGQPQVSGGGTATANAQATTETAAQTAAALAKARSPVADMEQPLLHIPRPAGTGVGAGIVSGVEGVAESLTAPLNILLMGAGGGVAKLGVPAARAVAGAFAAYTAEQFPSQLEKAMTEPDAKSKAAALTALALNTGAGALAGIHAANPGILEGIGAKADQIEKAGNPETARAYAKTEISKLLQPKEGEQPNDQDNRNAQPGPVNAAQPDGLLQGNDAPAPGASPQRDQPKPVVQDASQVGALKPALLVGGTAEVAQPGESHAAIVARPESEGTGLHSEDLQTGKRDTVDFLGAEPPYTYDEAQSRIDAIEDRLEKEGHDIIKLADPTSDSGKWLIENAPDQYKPMPPELVKAYADRDSIGSGQLKDSIREISQRLKTSGLNEQEINQVLSRYHLNINPNDASGQYIAAHHAQEIAGEPPERQAESIAYGLAAERGEMFDELKDVSQKTLRDAATAAKSVIGYFHPDTETASTPQPKESDSIQKEKVAQPETVASKESETAAPEPTDWTSATDDGPKLKLGGGERGSLNLGILGDAASKVGKKATELLRPVFSDLDEATAGRSAKLQKSFQEATRAQKELMRDVPSEARRNAISAYIEAAGDKTKLAAWEAGAKGAAFKAAARDAQNLNPVELAKAQKVKAAFDVLSARGQRYDALGSHRENYVPHVWDVDNKGSGIGSSKLQDKFKFAKARTFENFAEGDQSGFKPKTLDIAKLLPAYLHEMNKVIADRQFVQDVSHMTGKDGRPLVLPRGTGQTVEAEEGKTTALVNPRGFPKAEDAEGKPIEQGDYKTLDQPALAKWRWVESDPKGNNTILKGDLAAHPELAKRIQSMIGQSAVREWYNQPSTGLSVIPRAIVKNLDTAQSTMKREMFSLLAPFHQVQEAYHGLLGHQVNVFNVKAPDLRDAPVADAAKHGLLMYPEKMGSDALMEGTGGKGGFVSQVARWAGNKMDEKGIPIAPKAVKFVADVIDGYQDYLFHHYIPGLIYDTYAKVLPHNMELFAKELKSGEVSEKDVKLLTAQTANAAYGNVNRALLDRNPTIQHALQIGLLAPDFLEARGRFVAQSAKALLGQKAGIAPLKAIATIAAIQASMAYVATKLGGGTYDPKNPFAAQVGNRTYTMRSVPADLMRAAGGFFGRPQDSREFIQGRVNPLAQKAGQLVSGLNYRGEKTTALDTVGEMFANYIPITARWLPGVRELTETSRNSPISPIEQLAGSLSIKISRYSPITRTYELADKWMDAQKIDRPQGIYPTSKFQPLRYALEDADMGKAAAEYQKLLAVKGETAAKIARGFKDSTLHPFTGTAANDKQFAASLKNADKLYYENAVKSRQSILQKFAAVPGTAPTTEQSKRPRGRQNRRLKISR